MKRTRYIILAILASALVLAPQVASAQRTATRAAKTQAPPGRPAVMRTKVAREVRASDPRIEKARQKYLAKWRAGEIAKPTAKKQAKIKERQGLALKARAALEASGDKRGKLIILEGLDLSGKSSLARDMKAAFRGSGIKVRVVHWGAPGKETEAMWQTNYIKQFPKPGEVVIWDRSYMGRTFYDRYYGMISKKTFNERLAQINGLEASIGSQFDTVKFNYKTPGSEMARRIGKREAIRHDKLEPRGGDYKAFRDRKKIGKLRDKAIAGTAKSIPWITLDMSDSHAGKTTALKELAAHWSKQGPASASWSP